MKRCCSANNTFASSSSQNNQIEVVTIEDLTRLQQLETLNLQNNCLTTQGKNQTET